MFTGAVFLSPGQELREFAVLRQDTRETELGREVKNAETTVGKIRAILAAAKSDEKERWHQLGHPVTHKIIQQHQTPFDIKAGDVFEYKGRRFYNQSAPYNVGDLGHFTIYYCEERSDTQ